MSAVPGKLPAWQINAQVVSFIDASLIMTSQGVQQQVAITASLMCKL